MKYDKFLPALTILATPVSMLLMHYQQNRRAPTLQNLAADASNTNLTNLTKNITRLLTKSSLDQTSEICSLDHILGIKPPSFTND